MEFKNRSSFCLIALTLLLILSGCASNSKSTTSSNSKSQNSERPSWVESPREGCEKEIELCMVGMGTGPQGAEQNAKRAMADFFEAKISGKSTVTKTADSKGTAESTYDSAVTENFTSEISSVTNELLHAIFIKERFEDSERHYALAALNKEKASNYLKSEMQLLDERLEAILKEDRRTSLNKLLRVYGARENLNLRYELLKDRKFPQTVSAKQIASFKERHGSKQEWVYLQLSYDESAKGLTPLRDLVLRALKSEDYQVTLKDKDNARVKYHVRGKITLEKLHLAVNGFEKYRMAVDLDSLDREGKKLGALHVETTTTGRNLSNALEKGLPDLEKQFEENLDKLRI